MTSKARQAHQGNLLFGTKTVSKDPFAFVDSEMILQSRVKGIRADILKADKLSKYNAKGQGRFKGLTFIYSSGEYQAKYNISRDKDPVNDKFRQIELLIGVYYGEIGIFNYSKKPMFQIGIWYPETSTEGAFGQGGGDGETIERIVEQFNNNLTTFKSVTPRELTPAKLIRSWKELALSQQSN